MAKFLILALLSLLGSLSVFAQTPCEKVLNGLGPNWKFDKVTVPFNWNDPANSEKIEVYYYFQDQSLVQGKKPIVFFNGGPTMAGNSGIGLFGKTGLNDQNMIYIDQRGTGCSTNFKNYDQNTDIEIFKNYSSDSIVKDAEVIRKKMFASEKWKIFGQSYGGLISFRYLELFPQSIESVHIHGFGFSRGSSHIMEVREKRILELTPEILKYKNSKISPLTIGEIIERIKNVDAPAKEMFNAICIETPGALQKQFCGEDVFSGLYMITGFRNLWATAHKYFYNILLLIEKGDVNELSTYYKRFVSIYMLRFNDPNQAAALHAISYYELFPGHLMYDGCQVENDLISECRFNKNFVLRLHERPVFQGNPINLDEVKNNIKKHNVQIFYYAGIYDSFLPVQLLRETASYLDIESSFHVFPKSGHEGFYTEKLVIDNLVQK